MSPPACISDSTPLIALARIGRLDLVRSIFPHLVIPEAVAEEVVEARGDAPGAREVADADWIERAKADTMLVRPLLLLVDRGEAEAIAVAQSRPGSILLTDDRKARRVAKQLGIQPLGTLGVLARAKRGDLIPAVRPLVVELQSTGYRISEHALEEFLHRLDE
jgi:predicted nucleic acid-binding protein